jgi:hypothetical protein
MSPTSPRPYKNQQTKNLSSQNSFVRPKGMIRSKTIEGERKERLKRWITFFRRNPHRFIEMYFGIKLHPYQILMIWVLQRSNLAYIVASRAAAKTWIIAVWTLTLAVLYPGMSVVVCSKTLKQGGLLLSEKLTSLRDTHLNVEREIDHITVNSNTYEAIFFNGSKIKVVPSSDSARGSRGNHIVIEESRLVPKEILEQVIKPILEVRTPPFRLKPEYKNDSLLKEEGRISYITSAWYTAEYWYTYVKSCIKRMAAGDETANFLAFDYLLVLYHNIKTEEMIKNEMADMDTVSAQMEYLNIPSGSSGKSYFKPVLFPRNLKRAFYPQRDEIYSKKNKNEIKKVDGEIRFITVDLATRANKANDNSIIAAIRLIPILGKGYERHLCYMESHKGRDVEVQARRIKDIYFDFESDYLVIDVQNAGIGVWNSLTEPTICDDRGITYPALGIVDDVFDFIKKEAREDLVKNHTRSLNPLPVMFPISASQESNSQMASSLRMSLQKKLWHFLISDSDAEEFLIRNIPEFTQDINDSETYGFYMNPYLNTNLMISECINLDMSLVGGKIKLTEKAGCYKDRYSAILYANWVISSFDQELVKEGDDNSTDWDIISGLTQIF